MKKLTAAELWTARILQFVLFLYLYYLLCLPMKTALEFPVFFDTYSWHQLPSHTQVTHGVQSL